MCQDAEKLATSLVTSWLAAFMFRNRPDTEELAARVAAFFADSTLHMSHAAGIDRDLARRQGLEIVDLEDDPALQDAVLTVHRAAMHTLGGTGAGKIIENHMGRAFVVTKATINVPFALAPLNVPPQVPPA